MKSIIPLTLFLLVTSVHAGIIGWNSEITYGGETVFSKAVTGLETDENEVVITDDDGEVWQIRTEYHALLSDAPIDNVVFGGFTADLYIQLLNPQFDDEFVAFSGLDWSFDFIQHGTMTGGHRVESSVDVIDGAEYTIGDNSFDYHLPAGLAAVDRAVNPLREVAVQYHLVDSSIPEPSTLALLFVGVVALCFRALKPQKAVR